MAKLSLTEQQLEDLLELGNMGAGNAASALSEMIHKRCMMDVPEATILPTSEMKEAFDLERVLAVAMLLKVFGDIPSAMIVLMKRTDVNALLNQLIRFRDPSSRTDLSYTALAALGDVGEALVRAFMTAVSQFLEVKLRFAMPEVITGTWTTALEAVLSKIGAREEEQLAIHSRFYSEEAKFEGQFVYVLNAEAVADALARIGLLEAE